MPFDLSPLWISIRTAGLATIVTSGLGVATAYWMLGYRGRWKSLIEGGLLAPLVLPPTVVGFLLLLLFGKNGALGQLFLTFNFTIVFTWYAAVIAAIVVSLPLMYKTALGAFEQIDPSLLQVARTLGASEVRIFWRIVLPLAIPGILAGMTLAFARALGEFGATLMLAGNIPGQTQTMPMAIYFAVEAGANQEAWFWAIVILCISLSGIVMVNVWQQSRGRRQGSGEGGGNESKREQRQAGSQSVTHSAQPAKLQTLNSKLQTPNSKLSPAPNVGLYIEIDKRLSGFCLQTAFRVEQEVLGILGGSGAGKSMLLRCIAGSETPTRGRIILNGRVLFDAERQINLPSRDRRIGFLVQNYALFPHLTVAQNIAFGLPRRLDVQTRQRTIAAQLQSVQLAGLGNRYPHQLSGGQQQRVALARALASQPELLLLDEPFSALDTHLRSQLERQMIQRLTTYQGTTLFVTHNLEEAYRVCSNLLVMSAGKPIAFGSKQTIFEHPQTVTVAQLTGCKNFSCATVLSEKTLRAEDWNCILHTLEPIQPRISHVGIRAHHLAFVSPAAISSQEVKVIHDLDAKVNDKLNIQMNDRNIFPCWLAAMSETPHRVTLYLKINAAANHPEDYHVQAEVYKEKWLTWNDRPFPWLIQLDPLRLMLLAEESAC